MQLKAKKILINSFRAALLIFLSFLFGTETRAGKIPFKSYTTAEGLAHDRVNRIVRDSRGFLWFCTGEGLSRFDGYEFKNYTQADGLPHRNVNDLLELGDSTYLVATDDGLAFFDPKGTANSQSAEPPSMFRTFRVSLDAPDERLRSVSNLLKARNGKIWATTSLGLCRLLREESGEWRFEKIEGDAWRGKNIEPLGLIEDRFERLWLGSALGVFVFNPASGETFLLPETTGLSLVEDELGRIWSGGGIDKVPGLYLFDAPNANESPVLQRRFTTADGLTDNVWFNSMLKTSDGRILVGIANGLCEFLPEAKAGELPFRALFTTDIVSLAEDSGGNLWVGTATRGAFKLIRRGFVLYQAKEQPPYGGVTSIFPGSGNEVFVTSSHKNLLRFDGEKFSEIPLDKIKSRSWGWGQLDLRSRADGDWWFPTSFGLVRYPAVKNIEDLAHTPPKNIYTKRDGLFADEIFRLFEDSRGDMWFSLMGAVEDTVMRWERKSGKIYGYTTADNLPAKNTATAFAEDSEGGVWLGFYAGGAARWRNGKFQMFSARDGFPVGLVNSIHADRRGRLWLAVSNSGVIRVDNPLADEPRFVSLNVGNGLSSNQANCLTEDNFGRIYVGTARGINRIEPESGRIKLYTQADGLPGSSVSRCTRDETGTLWFSQKFNLARLEIQADENFAPPPIFIGDLRVNGETIKKLSELGETAVEQLDFNSEQRQIQIGFFALGFGTGETLRYQYKLEAADWSEPSAQRTVNLNLAPGSYNFLVRAVNAEGVASENPARVSFTIARPVWQRWWFMLLAAVAVSFLIYALYRYRIAQVIKLERVRTRIATDLHDDIGSSLSKIAILSEVVRQRNGSNQTEKDSKIEPLEIIANTSREMVDSMSDIVWAINPERDHLSDLIQRMRHFTEELLDARDIGYQFRVPENLKDIALGADQRREIYLIFKECINNLAKHSGAAEAYIKIDLDNENLVVEVTDDGHGFDPAAKSTGNSHGFGGNGLINIRRRAENLGGALAINSEPAKGAKIVLRVPVGKKLFAI
ncbi:MAG TPA: two-component regulator propeller domain-containing protein [Pyrinomonadaceae bacterium]|jgi:signal transduction histidine kinase/ligand-binding sensor domain-containing protein